MQDQGSSVAAVAPDLWFRLSATTRAGFYGVYARNSRAWCLMGSLWTSALSVANALMTTSNPARSMRVIRSATSECVTEEGAFFHSYKQVDL
ncbi:hypothetical protein AMS69_17915 [Haloarcula rubripromontorii]|uniref:Uncharacterized protein n=1 Tax=Haloarcula rubripromontorii TaxID=1705562 RepID=A0A0M9AGI6_9EURY|nr:hypothetical protein AMS69_17915 [Haloarcula rubripromontorii]